MSYLPQSPKATGPGQAKLKLFEEKIKAQKASQEIHNLKCYLSLQLGPVRNGESRMVAGQ